MNKIIEAAKLRLQKQYNQVPEPTNVSVSLVNKAYESVKEAEKNVTGVYVKLKVLLNRVTGYEAQREATKKKYLDITTGIADKLAVAEEYVAKYQYPYVQPGLVEDKNNAPGQDITAGVVSSNQTSAQFKNTLERLPLPTFDGKKMNYLRFKKEFSNHVTYASDKERMLALKTKCLRKEADRSCVQNEQSLKECWERLDEIYGDVNTLVAEIFQSWSSMKPPRNDQEFIKFVTAIENGVSCLRSIGHEKEMEFSFMSVTLEQKMDERMKKEFSASYTNVESTDKERMKSLLKYLQQQKKAAHMRTCNYGTKNVKDDEQPIDPIKSNSSMQSDSHRGGGRGGGRGGRSRGSDSQQGRGRGGGQFRGRGGARGLRGKRGETAETCLVCENDHLTFKCDTWRNKSTNKAELYVKALKSKLCTYCLKPGHWVSNCYSEEKIGCPCGSEINQFICTNTQECMDRKNWIETDKDATATKSGAGFIKKAGKEFAASPGYLYKY